MIYDKISIADDVYLIGKNDDRVVPFHRLMLEKGTTYNSYLVEGEKRAVIDTVDISFGKEYVEALSAHTDPAEIDYIVINHVEPDHSGGLPALAARAKNAVIVCSAYAESELKQMYNLYSREFLIVGDGDSLDLGGKRLRFIDTPWLHTEERMVTFLEEEGILFPCDIFSTHLANETVFEDQAGFDIDEDYLVYYKLIMHPHRRHVQDMLAKIADLPIKMIAPSHGYILRRDPQRFIALYEEASRENAEARRAVVLYATMTGNTKKLAGALAQELKLDEVETELFNIDKDDFSEIISAVRAADLVLIGTATRYADMIGRTEELLSRLAELDLSGKIAGAFGSYGWSGEGIEVLHNQLEQTSMRVLKSSEIIKTTGVNDVQFPLRIRFLPKEETERILKRTANYLGGILKDAS